MRDYGLFLDAGLPALFTTEVAGTVVSIGQGVEKVQPGDTVFGQGNTMTDYDVRGSQEYSLLEENTTFREPKRISAGAATTLLGNLMPGVRSFFSSNGFRFPLPGSADFASFDFAHHILVIIGGGTDVGKLAIQLAHLIGIGTIIVTASTSSTVALRELGATHVIDRRETDDAIKHQVSKITQGREILTVYDAYNSDHTLAVSLLSEQNQGKVMGILPSLKVDESRIGIKSAGYDIQFAIGHIHTPFDTLGPWFMETLPEWIESGKIKPTPYKDLDKGLDVDVVNKILDDYRNGRDPGRYHIHAN